MKIKEGWTLGMITCTQTDKRKDGISVTLQLIILNQCISERLISLTKRSKWMIWKYIWLTFFSSLLSKNETLVKNTVVPSIPLIILPLYMLIPIFGEHLKFTILFWDVCSCYFYNDGLWQGAYSGILLHNL